VVAHGLTSSPYSVVAKTECNKYHVHINMYNLSKIDKEVSMHD
jgi:hypothetical protein